MFRELVILKKLNSTLEKSYQKNEKIFEFHRQTRFILKIFQYLMSLYQFDLQQVLYNYYLFLDEIYEHDFKFNLITIIYIFLNLICLFQSTKLLLLN